MYSAQRAIIRLERSNDSRADALLAPKSFRMMPGQTQVLNSESKDNTSNGVGDADSNNSQKLTKEQQKQQRKRNSNFIKKNIRGIKEKNKGKVTPRQGRSSYGKINKEMQVLRNNLNHLKKERDEKVYKDLNKHLQRSSSENFKIVGSIR